MSLTGLSSVNGTTSAIEDKGLRDFISTASGSWTGGGGGSGPVTSTGGTTTYINKLNNMNLSASVAYTSPNGALLDNVYDSGRSGYAASAYLKNNVTANVTKWNNGSNFVTAYSGGIAISTSTYNSYDNPNFWQYSANNIYGFKINSGNFSQLSVANARIAGYRTTGGLYAFDMAFCFNKFIPTNSAATYSTVQNNFIQFGSLHICSPVYTILNNEWGTTFGSLSKNTTWADGADLTIWNPYTGYTGQNMFLTARFYLV